MHGRNLCPVFKLASKDADAFGSFHTEANPAAF
jgi:hypothetical protein